MWRRLRGIAGTALVWAAVWTLGYFPFALTQWRAGEFEHPRLPLWILGVYTLVGTAWGALSGAAFALLLSARERRTGWAGLTNRRVARWGALGGAMPAVAIAITIIASDVHFIPWLALSVFTTGSGLLGAGLALGHVGLARRAAVLAVTVPDAAT